MFVDKFKKDITPVQRLALDFFYGPEFNVLHNGLDSDNRGFEYRTLGTAWALIRLRDTCSSILDFSGLLAFDCRDLMGLYREHDSELPIIPGMENSHVPAVEISKLRDAAIAAQKLALGETVDPAVFEHDFSFEKDSVTIELYRGRRNERGQTIPMQIAAHLRHDNRELFIPKPETQPIIKFLCNFQNQASLNRLLEDSYDEVVLQDRPDLAEAVKDLNCRLRNLAYNGDFMTLTDAFERAVKQGLRDTQNQLLDLVTYVATKSISPNFTEEEKLGLCTSLQELEQALQPIYAQEKDIDWKNELELERKEIIGSTIDI